MRLGANAAAMGSLAEQKRLDVIANNMANANTVAFKRDETYFRDFLDQITYTVMDQGPIRETGQTLDLAISGNGFFKVKTDQGTLYTRAGNLTLDSNRELVTQQGWPVLGRNGPIKIQEPSTVRIEAEGQVFDKGQQVDSIEIVQFPADTPLKKLHDGLFEPTSAGADPIPAKDSTLKQGAIEGANFNMVEQMVHMVDTMRVFEAYQKSMQVFDKDLDSQIISRFAMT